MAKAPDQTYQASANFKIPYLKEGLHSAFLPVADELFDLIGRVAAHWGAFEHHFDVVIAAVLVVDGREVPGWKRMSFKKRKELLLDLVSYPGAPVAEVEAFRKVCATAASLHWRRNVIVHGRYAMTVLPYSSSAIFRAEGEVKGRAVTIPLNHTTLEKLWHDIAHLSAALRQAAEMIGEIGGFWPTLPDTELLRAARQTSQTSPPTQHMWQPPPQSLKWSP